MLERLGALALLQGDTVSRQKKTGHAAQQDRADIHARRRASFAGQDDLNPERLIFIDET